jgi:hypothetical protein
MGRVICRKFRERDNKPGFMAELLKVLFYARLLKLIK